MTIGLLTRESVDANGVSLEAVALGDGPPTVVFVNGLGAPLEEWALVAPQVAERCRVICYDRRVPPRTGPVPAHDTSLIVGDLHELLRALNVTGPLVLVGHSWGGAVIRRYCAEHAADVVGLVYVDATHENIKGMKPTRFSRALYSGSTAMLRVGLIRRRMLRSLGFERLSQDAWSSVDELAWLAEGRVSLAEYAGIGPSLQELAATAPELHRVPSRVLLAAGRPGLMTKLAARQIAAIRAVWEQAVSGRDDITLQVVADSGHYISLDQPQAVIDAIDDVLRRATT